MRELTEPYISKWISLSGTVRDVDTEKDNRTYVSIENWKGVEYPLSGPLLIFNEEWKYKLTLLKRHDTLSVVCQIYSVAPFMQLNDCQLFER